MVEAAGGGPPDETGCVPGCVLDWTALMRSESFI
jgi:hypothetical protein